MEINIGAPAGKRTPEIPDNLPEMWDPLWKTVYPPLSVAMLIIEEVSLSFRNILEILYIYIYNIGEYRPVYTV